MIYFWINLSDSICICINVNVNVYVYVYVYGYVYVYVYVYGYGYVYVYVYVIKLVAGVYPPPRLLWGLPTQGIPPPDGATSQLCQ